MKGRLPFGRRLFYEHGLFFWHRWFTFPFSSPTVEGERVGGRKKRRASETCLLDHRKEERFDETLGSSNGARRRCERAHRMWGRLSSEQRGDVR